MRIAHITDIHVTRLPKLHQLTPKRLLGTANLLIGGRRTHFSEAVQAALVKAVADQEPDAIICTGDLTQTATPGEFEAAAQLLGPLFERTPTVLIPGNHDTYTREAWLGRHMERYFPASMGHGDWPRVHHLSPEIAVVCVDTCRAHLSSSGRVEDAALTRLDALLSGESLAGKTLLVAIHYPLRDHRGAPYGPPSRALENARALEAILLRHATKLTAILHGHEHRGFQTTLGSGQAATPILNPGSSGYAWLPNKGRKAHFNIYTLDGAGLSVERFAYDGPVDTFLPEQGGAYATGG